MVTTYTEYINKDRKDTENNQAPIKQYPEQNVVLWGTVKKLCCNCCYMTYSHTNRAVSSYIIPWFGLQMMDNSDSTEECQWHPWSCIHSSEEHLDEPSKGMKCLIHRTVNSFRKQVNFAQLQYFVMRNINRHFIYPFQTKNESNN